ncbi:hypothetical protein [Paenibacillus harenae]|uniref:hypothetical protein n=1 Tax=Paenibacillus harenae TaxID=306543 RepID=UPI002791EF22|nr:hypothetical protein [Paenibacillus harenae]MDQ0060010.1 hypothetical protein [Paenibacillus harenae]
MEQEREIKTYMMYFIWIMNKLLIFNKSDEEGCRVCQGELYYYFDIEHDILIKECGTCSSWYHGKSDNTIKEFTKNIRPATRTDLIDNKISWNA